MRHSSGLRSYIAPGAPATRHPCDGTESALRIEFGFTPRWYRQHLDIDFSERWHEDVLYRAATVEQMRCELRKRFPGIPVGGNFEDMPAANLDGVYGALFVARLFGIPVEYYEDNWPAAEHSYLSETEIMELTPPELSSSPVVTALLEQMEVIEKEGGEHSRVCQLAGHPEQCLSYPWSGNSD